jgi:hypothetical protein
LQLVRRRHDGGNALQPVAQADFADADVRGRAGAVFTVVVSGKVTGSESGGFSSSPSLEFPETSGLSILEAIVFLLECLSLQTTSGDKP